KVGFVQISPDILEVESNVDKALRFIEKLDCDLVVLPELFNTGYNFSNLNEVERVAERIPQGFTTSRLKELSKERNMRLVAGIAERKDNNFFNSAIYIDSDFVGIYRKVHLFYKEKKFFQSGQEFSVFSGIGIMICFDWIFPEVSRILTLKGAKLICHPSNLVLPYCPEAMKVRSIENGIFTITADRVGEERGLKFIGLSQITDPKGKVLYRASEDEEEVHIQEIDLEKAQDKNITELNHLLKDRRGELYRDLTASPSPGVSNNSLKFTQKRF
ncbi:MAG: nitrilase-related carbon-nitrogen hydrolase, partial [Candidatus Methanofastidiosia archaeon]